MQDIKISTDRNLLDISMIHEFLTQSYWAKGRTLDEVRISIENSLCLGMYSDGKQIGFARIITDKVAFAYLMDVFILDAFRGKGYSKLLMQAILQHPDISAVKRVFLGTRDAHGLYEQFGFRAAAHPERWMERLRT